MRTLRFGPTALVIVCAAAASTPTQAAVTFSDTEFAPANWGSETAVLGTGGSSAAAQTGGGNPGFGREVTNSVNGGGAGTVYGFSRYGTDMATRYVPPESGAILSVDFTLDSRWLSGIGGQGQSIMLGAKQGQTIYFADFDVTGSNGAWTGHGATGLTAAAFAPLTTGPAINFSATGAAIRFGFIAGNSGDFAYSNTVLYDNFSVTIHNIPGPAGLAALGLLGLASARRRRSTI